MSTHRCSIGPSSKTVLPNLGMRFNDELQPTHILKAHQRWHVELVIRTAQHQLMKGPVLSIHVMFSAPRFWPASRRPSKPHHEFQEAQHSIKSFQRTIVVAFDNTLWDHGTPALLSLLLGIHVYPQRPHVFCFLVDLRFTFTVNNARGGAPTQAESPNA